MTQNQFVGTWRLIGTKIEDSQGRKSELFGPGATGQIIYSEQGYMSANCTLPNPPDLVTVCETFAGKLSPEQITSLSLPKLKNFSYAGKYEIEADTVIHHGEFHSEPIYSGLLPRLFEFTGNQLILSQYFPFTPGSDAKMHLIWERV
ncbi:lipocalin-like domain-containing protein [Limnofasciculus baicalensis]|uniref:Lipocalin-like domain-containing protein n=1 Tax=Limnofasciculus baicalensis BBK-W-15 TaxID=2699891 RepID=A0AAE3GU63_9CYAN|nr:lipocalin-like domain-containing protein [Limnofasciculus baicalensis]MCP2728617.1 lipocalin-like domain-containing protein [Limnofasciculus baicalensis BBK-W-15]